MPDIANEQVNRHIERLARTYGDLIVRLAYTRLGSTHAAQDICQDVFVALVRLLQRNPGAFEGVEHEKAWVIRATINACINEQQAARNRKVLPLQAPAGNEPAPEPADASAPDPAEAALAADTHARVLAAAAQLPPAQHTAIYLHCCEGYSATEIAEFTGEKPATVRQHLHRARTKLRDLLEEEDL